MRILPFFFLAIAVQAFGQDIKSEFDKNHDFSKYNTFSFGKSEVATPPDQKIVSDATIDKWVVDIVTRELEYKGLKRVDSAGDVSVTYVLVTRSLLDAQQIGPLGGTPGSSDRVWSRSYRQTSLIIDLIDRRNSVVFRINAVADIVGGEAERTIDLIVVKGFKKYKKTAKKKKA